MTEKTFNKHYYCSIYQSSLKTEITVCTKCNARKGVSYFVEMSFLKQLQEMYNRQGFFELLQHRFHRQGTTPDIISTYMMAAYTRNTRQQDSCQIRTIFH